MKQDDGPSPLLAGPSGGRPPRGVLCGHIMTDGYCSVCAHLPVLMPMKGFKNTHTLTSWLRDKVMLWGKMVPKISAAKILCMWHGQG